MQLGNLGKLTILNGDLHVELDVNIGGSAEAPLTADVRIDEFLVMLEGAVTNPLEKAAIGIAISILDQVNLQAKERSASLEGVPTWVQDLVNLIPTLIQIILAAIGGSPSASNLQTLVAKLQVFEKAIQS